MVQRCRIFAGQVHEHTSGMNLVVAMLQAIGGSQGGLTSMLLLFLFLFLIFYFFIIRPQKKRENERKAMIAAVRKNDKVVTAGGVHGTVLQVDDESVLVEVYTNVKIRFEKSALARVNPKG